MTRHLATLRESLLLLRFWRYKFFAGVKGRGKSTCDISVLGIEKSARRRRFEAFARTAAELRCSKVRGHLRYLRGETGHDANQSRYDSVITGFSGQMLIFLLFS
jgi:hypothetical protein